MLTRGFKNYLFYFILSIVIKLLTIERFSFFHFYLYGLSRGLGGQVNT